MRMDDTVILGRRRKSMDDFVRCFRGFCNARGNKGTPTTTPRHNPQHHPDRKMTSKRRRTTDTSTSADIATDTQAALPELPLDIVVTHILTNLSDPIDLARLRAVSRGMRDAVAATGREIKECSPEDAAGLGYVNTLQHKLPYKPYSEGIEDRMWLSALKGGHLEVLKWLRSKGCLWTERVCSVAAECGQLEILKWLRANGCPWDWWTCYEAARGGHLEVLQWVRANGCPWNELTCSGAAQNGHIEVLQWARANGCPWNEHTCEEAASGGHLAILKWLRANGCPWDARTIMCAQGKMHSERHLELLNWAIAIGCPEPESEDDDEDEGEYFEKEELPFMMADMLESHANYWRLEEEYGSEYPF